MRKILMIILALALMLSTFVGCESNEENEDKPKKTETTSSPEIPEETTAEPDVPEEPSSELVTEFVRCLKEQDYAGILALLKLPENSVVCADDVKSAMLRNKDFGDMLGKDVEITDLDISVASHTATLKLGNNESKVSFELNDNDELYLNIAGIYKTAEVIAPRGAEITINGVKLDELKWSKKMATTATERVVYTLICPAERTMKAHIKSDIGECDTDVIMSSDNQYTVCNKDTISDEMMDEILNTIRANVNEMLKLAENKEKSIEKYRPYFSEKTSNDLIESVITAMIAKVDHMRYGYNMTTNIALDRYIGGNNLVYVKSSVTITHQEGYSSVIGSSTDEVDFLVEKMGDSWLIRWTTLDTVSYRY